MVDFLVDRLFGMLFQPLAPQAFAAFFGRLLVDMNFYSSLLTA